jgi:hypothetical protein
MKKKFMFAALALLAFVFAGKVMMGTSGIHFVSEVNEMITFLLLASIGGVLTVQTFLKK